MIGLNVAARALAAGGSPPASASTVFDIDTWTGTGASNTITTPFAPGVVWIKSRSDATSHAIFDTSRGAGNYVSSNQSNAEAADTTTLNAFSSTGYTLTTDVAGLANTSARTYVGWAFKEQANFFDVVTWTGDGTNRTIAHGLGVAPGMILVKNRAAGNWQVYHRSLANTDYVVLNSSSGSATDATRWNSTTATSSVFSLGTATTVNNTGDAYVAYLFAHDTSGFVQCGSFTTDGSGNATVTLGMEPQWLLAKALGTSGWVVLDQTRGWGGTDSAVFANRTDAESTATDYGAPTGTGFTFANGGATVTWVYAAIKKA